ncbi:MAG: glycine cleavage system aminomethyltransferase GcvT [Candidatus Aadella gelida]|nr:glycine cleavage system aminomethyltransferase GcvT [Candidatus Aadella gelida]
MPERDLNLKRTPLYEEHLKLGAKIVPFSGWSMPLQYTGIIDEHFQTREKVGLFDICHMGELVVEGRAAENDLEKLLSCSIKDIAQGKCRYGFLLNGSGGIIDDLIVFRTGEETFMLVVNSATTQKDLDWILQNISSETKARDISEETAKIDLQGPGSSSVIKQVTGYDEETKLKRFSFDEISLEGIKILLSRTGYTGEAGYELFFDAPMAPRVWQALLSCEEAKPIGLGARDTLRMEMGYSLYGNDIDETRSPLEASLSAFVCMEKDFIGKTALIKQLEEGVEQVLKGFICEGRRSARKGFSVIIKGQTIGKVTSGGFSPSMQKGIGLCYLDAESSNAGTEILLTDGKIEIKAVISDMPIYKR